MAVSTEDIIKAHDCFCEEMEIKDSNWFSAFEFVQYAGFDLFNSLKCSPSNAIDVSPRTEQAIRQLLGPHAQTLLKAYKHRRYSWQGKLRKLWLAPAHAVGLGVCIVAKILRDFWKSW